MPFKRKFALTLLAALALSIALLATARSSANVRLPGKTVTFNKDVAPIFFNKCSECHHQGEAAPFSTLAYKDLRPWA